MKTFKIVVMWLAFIITLLFLQSIHVKSGTDFHGGVFTSMTSCEAMFNWCGMSCLLAFASLPVVISVWLIGQILVWVSVIICRLAGKKVVDPKEKDAGPISAD